MFLTKEEQNRFELVLEKKALQATIDELSKRDGRMGNHIDDICKMMEDKIKEIDSKL